MRDAQLGDTPCFDLDEAEERDVVHRRFYHFLSDASWTSADEVLSVRSVFGKTPGVPRFGDFPLFYEEVFSFLLAFASRLCRFSISGWLSQAVKSTNTNSRKIACGTLDTSQKLTCFLKTATLPMHTLEMQTHQRLPGCHQTVQEAVGGPTVSADFSSSSP